MEAKVKVTEVHEGMTIPGLIKHITQDNINLYAEVSQDYNPIHVDPEFARKTPAGGTIAHGMLLLSYVSQMMANAFGDDWISGGTLDIRFKTPARPGDTITVTSKVTGIENDDAMIVITSELLVLNQKQETVLTGETKVRTKK
jgi:3-hydroxybutyryl-CoA dehydratase